MGSVILVRENVGVVSRILRGGGAYFGVIFFSTIVSLITLPILLKNLTVEQYATFAMISVYLGIFSQIFDGSAKSAVTIEYNNYDFESDDFKSFLGVVMSLTTILGSLFCIGIIVVDSIFQPYKNFIIFDGFQTLTILKIAAILCLIGGFTPLMSVLYKMREEPRIIFYFTVLTSTVGLVTTYYYVSYLDLGINGAVRSLFITTLLGGFVCTLLILRKSNITVSLSKSKEILSYTLPLSLVAITTRSQQFADRILIEVLISNSEMAIYHLGNQMSNYMVILGLVIYNTWTPIFFEIMKNNPRAPEIVSKFTSLSVAIGALGIILFVEIGDVVLRIISTEEYSYSSTVMSMIACSVIPSLLYTFNGLRLIREKRTFSIAAISVTGAISNIVLNLLLLPELGLLGAGISAIITYTITASLVIYLSEKIDDIRLENKDLMLGSFAVIIAMLVREMQTFQQWYGTMITLSICIMMSVWAYTNFRSFRTLVD